MAQLKITKLELAIQKYRENKAKIHAEEQKNGGNGHKTPLFFDSSVEELVRSVMMKSRHRVWTPYEDE